MIFGMFLVDFSASHALSRPLAVVVRRTASGEDAEHFADLCPELNLEDLASGEAHFFPVFGPLWHIFGSFLAVFGRFFARSCWIWSIRSWAKCRWALILLEPRRCSEDMAHQRRLQDADLAFLGFFNAI